MKVQLAGAWIELDPAVRGVLRELQPILHHLLLPGIGEVNHIGAQVLGVEVKRLTTEDAVELANLDLIAEDYVPILPRLLIHLIEVEVVDFHGVQVSFVLVLLR